jgi:Protein of unknown function (DUF2961)/HEAT repeats
VKSLLIGMLLFISGAAGAQTPANDFLDGLGLARLKNYSSYRVSSSNRYVLSNDDSKRIMPGETLVMANLTGAGMVTHIWLTIAQNEFGWPRLLRLRVYYDGHKTPSVDAPLGDFFAVGHGAERDVSSMIIRDSSFGRARNSYWPMPFRKSCLITLTNEGDRFVPMFYYHVDYRKYASLPADIGYFHAYYRQERPARSGQNYEFLKIHGTGHYVGTVLSVVQTQISWFGEGDDLFYIDGAKRPQIYGTGTEDYFNDAWNLRDVSGPWTGTPIAEGELPGSRLSAYRWHVPDPIAFTQSIWAGIEHSGWTSNPDGSFRSSFEERLDYFSSVAFWYQAGVNEELPEPPYGAARLPFGNATQIAIEDSIKDVTTEGGKASVLKDVDWAKDLLLLTADGVGARMNVPIEIAENGQYEIVANIAEAPDYGDYVALMDGKPTNIDTRKPATSEIPLPGPEVFRNYQRELYLARDHTLGIFDLAKGRHILSLVCQGKDPRSVGYNLGITDVVLERMYPAPTELAPVAEGTAGETAGVVYRGHRLSYYLAELKDASDRARATLIRTIGWFGAQGAPAGSELIAALSDHSIEVRVAAVAALAQVGRHNGPAAVPALAGALADPAPGVRTMAAVALRAEGAKAAAAVPQLIRALDDPVDYVRASAADAIGAIGPGASGAVHPLAERLLMTDEHGFVLASVAYALGDLGSSATDALPALRQALSIRRVGPAAQEAILKIEGKPVPLYH